MGNCTFLGRKWLICPYTTTISPIHQYIRYGNIWKLPLHYLFKALSIAATPSPISERFITWISFIFVIVVSVCFMHSYFEYFHITVVFVIHEIQCHIVIPINLGIFIAPLRETFFQSNYFSNYCLYYKYRQS